MSLYHESGPKYVKTRQGQKRRHGSSAVVDEVLCVWADRSCNFQAVHVEHTKYKHWAFWMHIEPENAANSRIFVHGVPKMLLNSRIVVHDEPKMLQNPRLLCIMAVKSKIFVHIEPRNAANSRICMHAEPTKNAVNSRIFLCLMAQTAALFLKPHVLQPLGLRNNVADTTRKAAFGPNFGGE